MRYPHETFYFNQKPVIDRFKDREAKGGEDLDGLFPTHIILKKVIL